MHGSQTHVPLARCMRSSMRHCCYNSTIIAPRHNCTAAATAPQKDDQLQRTAPGPRSLSRPQYGAQHGAQHATSQATSDAAVRQHLADWSAKGAAHITAVASVFNAARFREGVKPGLLDPRVALTSPGEAVQRYAYMQVSGSGFYRCYRYVNIGMLTSVRFMERAWRWLVWPGLDVEGCLYTCVDTFSASAMSRGH